MEYKLGEVESRFAELIWSHEPIGSGELVKLCAEQLEWKKSTTYTVLKKLCDKGYFQNVNGIVTSLVSRKESHVDRSRRFVEETFGGSLPAFLSAFTAGKKLDASEVAVIRQMINEYEMKEKQT